MQTLYDKLWSQHIVPTESTDAGSMSLIYIDRHLVHEVTSPQAFESLKLAGRKPWRLNSILAVADHNVPTTDRSDGIQDPISRLQVDTLDQNCDELGITQFKMNDLRQGIVHVIGPEQGATLPGMTVVCGDSHTSTHGAFGCLAFGIGTSEVEHVLATQCLLMKKSKTMHVVVEGQLGLGVTAKDIALAIIGKIGTAGGTGYAIEFADTTINYIKGRPFAPQGEMWERAVTYWKTLHSEPEAVFDRTVTLDAAQIKPQVTWGTSPEMVTTIDGTVPDPARVTDEVKRKDMQHALNYMGLKANMPIQQITVDKVFIGSCTNSRIEDLRAAAQVVKNKKIAANIKLAMVVPGSGLVKQQAEQEGLDKIFTKAGFEWREPGCSMCLAMNDDRLNPGERCASTSNRNFEGRQGSGGRTHLVSPAMAAAAAIAGHFVDVRKMNG